MQHQEVHIYRPHVSSSSTDLRFSPSFLLSLQSVSHSHTPVNMFGLSFGSKKFPYVERDRTVYTALRDGASWPSDEGDGDEKALFVRPSTKKSGRFWRAFVILLLLSTNATTLVALLVTRHLASKVDAVDPVYTPDSWGFSHLLFLFLTEMLMVYSSRRHAPHQMDAAQLVDRVQRQELHRDRRPLGRHQPCSRLHRHRPRVGQVPALA